MKSKPRLLLIVLTLLAGVLSSLAELGIAPAGNQTVLYWPTTTTNYVLQSTTNLTAPDWETATDAVPVVAFTVINTSPTRFFRLYSNTTNPPAGTTNPPAGMVLIPGGVFTIGNSIGDSDIGDATPMDIYVSAFYMDTNLVSYSQWQAVYAYATNNGYYFDNTGAGKATNHPVNTVKWYEVVKWSNARSQQAGLEPVYYTDAGFTQVYNYGDVDAVYAKWSANGYRLPTEAEWEKAARGGLTGLRFPWGNTISESQANYAGNAGYYSYDLGPNGLNAAFTNGVLPNTSPVGSFPPNGYGIYDMAGNENEWCWDWYGIFYGQPKTNNPTGPPSGSTRMLRGGDWGSSAYYARSAFRFNYVPSLANIGVGFRCVKGP